MIYFNLNKLGVMVKVVIGGLDVSEFELQSCYYIHFRTNTLVKSINTLIQSTLGKIASLLFFN